MNPLAAHLWQSTLVLALAGLTTLCLRGNGAHVRHALWTAASLKFLLPFALLSGLGAWAARLLDVTLPSSPALETLYAAARPFAAPALALPGWNAVLPGAWALGAAILCGVWFSRWLALRAALRNARDTAIAAPMPVRCAAAQREPGLVGIFRPVLLLPEGIAERLTPAELAAVIAHEACHLRRRDNLMAALHMLVQAVFWFWPPVWWLGSRLIAERERACDEAVLAAGSDPETYATGILKVCKFYVSSPLACAAGIAGANLSQRMETIMENRMIARLNGMKKALLGGIAAALVLAPMAAGLSWSPAQAQGASACKLVSVPGTHTLPPYPAESQRARETGQTLLHLTIARNGHVGAARVARSSGHPRLDAAAASFVRQNYLWRPLSCGSAQTNLKVVWSLKDAK